MEPAKTSLFMYDDNQLPLRVDHQRLERVLEQIGQVILGKPRIIRLALTCLLSRGHLLIEDQPGMGKTTLAHALARTLGFQYQRIQFTSDLLPADILGAAVYEREQSAFVFHPGPIFTQLILADEINRASPKTQSALLEAMEEQQVTIEGVTHPLPEPFFVIATQNPAHQVGTFPLPESQLDRFLMRLELGYPDPRAERQLLEGEDRRSVLARLPALLQAEDVIVLQQSVSALRVSPPLLDYLQALLAATRLSAELRGGLSPRAGLGLLRAARAWAMLEQRDYVVPEDVQAVLVPVIGHRLQSVRDNHEEVLQQLIESVPVPV